MTTRCTAPHGAHGATRLRGQTASAAAVAAALLTHPGRVATGGRVRQPHSLAGADGRQPGSRGRDRRALAQPGDQHEPFRARARAALVVGVVIGVWMGLSRWADLAFSDLNAGGLAIPAVIWALLTTMWFGFGWLTPVVTVFLSGLPFVVVNIAKATRAVPADLVLMARSFGVPRSRRAAAHRRTRRRRLDGRRGALRDHERLERAVARRVVRLHLGGRAGAPATGTTPTSSTASSPGCWCSSSLLVVADLLILGPIERYVTRWRTA